MNHLYLCKPGGVILGIMSGLDENSVSLHKTVGIWELTFNVSKYLYEKGERIKTTYYDFISERMELYLDTEEEKARFIITAEPAVMNDGTQEVKSVTAQSIECELQDKFLRLFDINTGQKISQENLLRDDDGHDYNLNPYTKLPIDYISVHRNYITEMTQLKNQIQDGYIEWDTMDTDDGTEQTEMKHFILQYGSDGLITAEDDPDNLFPRYISNLLKVYPRLQNNIVYGIDKRTNSQTIDQEICTTESYLKIINDAVHIPLAQFRKEKIDDKDCILDPTEPTYPALIDSVNDLIEFYTKYNDQLSMLDLCLQKATHMGWTVGEVPDDIGKRKYSFSVQEEAIYTFLTQTCANTMKVVFDFDRLRKKVNIIDVSGEDYEHDTGVFIGLQNLANEINIEESSEDGIRTKFLPKGANDLGITLVNFGEEEMINLDYFMHRTDEDGEHQFVSEEMREKYDAWKSYRDEEEATIEDIPTYEYILSSKLLTNQELIDKTYPSRREAYIDLTKRYNQTMIDIDEFENLLPDDGCLIDYTTFTFDELVTAWKAYQNALDALLQLYKEDYKVAVFNMETLEAYDIHMQPVTSIKYTMYWHDFDGYVYTIIPNVENALKIYVYTDAEGNFTEKSKDENGEWVYYEGGNPNYNGNSKIVTENKSDAYLYDMTLYGRSELDIKRQAWSEVTAQLYKDGFVLERDEDGNPTKYNTADDAGWEVITHIYSTPPARAKIVANYSYHVLNNSSSEEEAAGSLTNETILSYSDEIITEQFNFININDEVPWHEQLPNYESGYKQYLYQVDSLMYSFDSGGEEPAGDITYGAFGYALLDPMYEGGTFTINYTATNTNNVPIRCALRCTISAYPSAYLPDFPNEYVTLQPNESITVSGTYTHNNHYDEYGIPKNFYEGYSKIILFATPYNIPSGSSSNPISAETEEEEAAGGQPRPIVNYDDVSDICTIKITNASIRLTKEPAYLLNWTGILSYKDNSTTSVSGNDYDIEFDEKTYENLSDIFSSKEDFISKMNRYLDYVSFEERENSLTKEINKGVIRMAEDEISKCNLVIDTLTEYQDWFQEQRNSIADSVNFENWNFTDTESGIIHSLIREANYGNENILITNLDNIVSKIDVEKELYDDTAKKLFEMSRPQYSFSLSLDNLLSIKEFVPLKSSIQLLNYIYLKLGIYENAFVRIRIVGIQYNPLISSSDIELDFSNMVYTYDGLSDIDKLLGETSGAVSNGASGGSGSGGTLGENDAGIQISNNMLNALLANNGYISNSSLIIAQSSSDISQALGNAGYKIDGTSLTNCIKSDNYNGTNLGIDNTNGFILRISDGKFNLADGNLKYDGTNVSITGNINATSFNIIGDGKINGQYINGAMKNVSFYIDKNEVPNSVSNNYTSPLPYYCVLHDTYIDPNTQDTIMLKTEIGAGFISLTKVIPGNNQENTYWEKTVITTNGIKVVNSDLVDEGTRSGYNYDIDGGQDNPL